MENITIKINGVEVSAPAGSTILEAARLAHIDIPTLCYLKEINEIGACRMCIVEVKGARSLVASCVYPINPGMEVWTNTPKVIESRKKTLELLLSNHKKECLSCVRSGNCELQQLCKELGVEDENYYSGEMTPAMIDTSAAHMVRDNSKCILCRRCSAVCEKVQVSASSARMSVVLRVISVQHLTWIWLIQAVYPVVSALLSVRQVLYMRKTTQTKSLQQLQILINMLLFRQHQVYVQVLEKNSVIRWVQM